ncbi:hypothetical protein C1I99_18865 [Micromonospora deserti]|uniref:Uncharacterized protein n=1 Tax=Micromonospora deserti TaxID=2070366 RepID=A0A2W2C8A9_9ACTN|nr:hypothetical protein C1I99_18865 [Micromonospora deserti]
MSRFASSRGIQGLFHLRRHTQSHSQRVGTQQVMDVVGRIASRELEPNRRKIQLILADVTAIPCWLEPDRQSVFQRTDD